MSGGLQLGFGMASAGQLTLHVCVVCAVGDYDGEVSQIDLETGHMVAEVDGHAGRRWALCGGTAWWPLVCDSHSPFLARRKLWGMERLWARVACAIWEAAVQV